MIGREEVKAILNGGRLKEPGDILHRTRLAKGTCQGGFCVYRFLGLLHELGIAEGGSNKVLKDFLEERWKGIRPVLWGDSLRQEELVETIYKGIFNLTPTHPSPLEHFFTHKFSFRERKVISLMYRGKGLEMI